jgi:hypothetical protein
VFGWSLCFRRRSRAFACESDLSCLNTRTECCAPVVPKGLGVNAQTKQAKKVGVAVAAGPMAGDMTNEATPRHERAEQVEGAVARSHALAPIVSDERLRSPIKSYAKRV